MMKTRNVVGAVLLGLPLIAAGQAASTGDLESMAKRQKELERQVQDQDARIRELERLLKERIPGAAGEGAPGAAAAAGVTAAATAPAPGVQGAPRAAGESPATGAPATPSAGAGASPQAVASSEAPASGNATAPPVAPEYVGNLGFKIYEGEKGQIYMRLMAYARYLNQKGLDSTYTDSFGNVKTVSQREDFQLNKFFLPFAGWFLDPKWRYYLYVWSTNTAQGEPAQVVGAGNVSYVMNSYATFGFGITSLPGVRSTEGQFPYWLGVDDRLIADEFFRPSYTTGVWVKGEFMPGLNYMAMVGNNLSTLGISAAQLDNTIDTYSLMVNWLPTTHEYGPLGAFGDYESHEDLATRLGIHFTHSTEDRQSQPGTETIDNTQIRLTDGNVIFTPNLFGPGITVEKVRYQMASLDAGLKYRGYSLEGEYYRRWLGNYVGPGTATLDSISDNGYQLQASAMVVPRLWQVYAGLSQIFGDYGDAREFRLGFNYFPQQMRGLRINGEWMNMDNCPVGYTAVPYPVGANGNIVNVNLEYNF
jgi:hypothetical protein